MSKMEENLTEGIIEQMEKRHEAERTFNEMFETRNRGLLDMHRMLTKVTEAANRLIALRKKASAMMDELKAKNKEEMTDEEKDKAIIEGEKTIAEYEEADATYKKLSAELEELRKTTS